MIKCNLLDFTLLARLRVRNLQLIQKIYKKSISDADDKSYLRADDFMTRLDMMKSINSNS